MTQQCYNRTLIVSKGIWGQVPSIGKNLLCFGKCVHFDPCIGTCTLVMIINTLTVHRTCFVLIATLILNSNRARVAHNWREETNFTVIITTIYGKNTTMSQPKSFFFVKVTE